MAEDADSNEGRHAPGKVRWRRLLKLLVRSVGVLLGLLLLGAAIEAWRGASQLSRLLAEGTQAGEVFEIAELMPPIPAPDQNAAIPLLTLTNELRDADEVLRRGPPLWVFDEQRRLRPIRDVDRWELERSILSDNSSSNNWTAFAAEFGPLESLADQVQAALERPAFQSGFDYHRGFRETGLVPLLVERARVGDLLIHSFVRHVRQGSTGDAKQRLQALVKWGGMQQGDRLIISEMIRYRGLEKTVRALRHGLDELSWTDDELAQLQQQVEGWNLINGIVRAYELERAMSLDFLHAAAHDAEVRERQFKLWQQIHDNVGPGFSPYPDKWMKRVRLPLWSLIWWRQESARSLQQWDLMIHGLRNLRSLSLQDSKESWDSLPHTHRELFLDREEVRGLDRWRFIFVSDFTFMARMPVRVLKLETERQMLLAALALRRFQMREERLPEALSELIPDLLSRSPVDAMDGEPLRFRRRGAGEFSLYSVGKDYEDDAGNPNPARAGRDYTDIWDGRDAVWPAQGSGTAR